LKRLREGKGKASNLGTYSLCKRPSEKKKKMLKRKRPLKKKVWDSTYCSGGKKSKDPHRSLLLRKKGETHPAGRHRSLGEH